jgi:hypothetical protein
MNKNQKGFSHPVLLILMVAVLAAIGYVGYKVYNNNKPPKTTNSAPAGTKIANDSFMRQYGQNCPDRQVSFTSPPMALDNIGYIRPLGAMGDGHVTPTDHVYIIPSNKLANDEVSGLMPADGKVIEVSQMPAQYIGDNQNVQRAPEDYHIVVAFSCRYFAIFIHLHKLSPKLAAAVGQLRPDEHKSVNIELKAGEPIAAAGSSGYDWIPIDTTKTLGFITPKLYERESWKVHTVSPYDLYSGALKSQLEAKSLRSIPPIGGKIDYDQRGKLIGNWFRQGTSGYQGSDQSRYWDGHLSVVPDSVDPSGTIVSIGNWQGTTKQYGVIGSPDPSKVDIGSGMIKYQLAGFSYSGASFGSTNFIQPLQKPIKFMVGNDAVGTIAFQVMADEKLKVEKFPGKTPEQVTAFTSAAQMYER